MPTYFILLAAVALFGLIAFAVIVRRNSGGDMIERQRRQTPVPPPAPPPHLDGSLAPDNRPSDEAALVAVPEIRNAIQRGRTIEAVKHVREATGMGLKESKELVERHMRRRRGR